MRIEITSAQAGRPTRTPRVPALSAKPFAKPFATGPRTAKPFTAKPFAARPFAAQPLAAAAFSPAAATPVPVRWDAVRG